MPFHAGHAAADIVCNAICHRCHREATVEAEAVAAQIAPGVLVEFEGMESTAEAGLDVAQQGIDPVELRQVVGVLAAGNNGLVVTIGYDHGAEAGQAIGEHMAAGHQLRLAQSAIASELKPLTAEKLV